MTSLAVALVVVYRPLGDLLYLGGDLAAAPGAGAVDLPAGRGRTRSRAVLGLCTRAACWRSPRCRSCSSTRSCGCRDHLWLSLGFPGVEPDQAWNTAVSFVTNTNWQSYSGESTMGHLVQMAGLAVQNFVSAAVGIAVAVALVRGFARTGTDGLGNFWVDLTRICLRILLPIAVVGAIVFVAAGMVQNLSARHRRHHAGRATASTSPAGRWPARRSSRSSAPTAAASTTPTARTRSRTRRRWTNWLEIFLLLLIPFSLPRIFGRMVGDNRQGYAIVAVMAISGVVSIVADQRLPAAGRRHRAAGGRRRDGGQGDPVRRPAVGDLRRGDDADLDRRGGLVPRLVHRARRRWCRSST